MKNLLLALSMVFCLSVLSVTSQNTTKSKAPASTMQQGKQKPPVTTGKLSTPLLNDVIIIQTADLLQFGVRNAQNYSPAQGVALYITYASTGQPIPGSYSNIGGKMCYCIAPNLGATYNKNLNAWVWGVTKAALTHGATLNFQAAGWIPWTTNVSPFSATKQFVLN